MMVQLSAWFYLFVYIQALRLIDLYAKKGFDPEMHRIYIKVDLFPLMLSLSDWVWFSQKQTPGQVLGKVIQKVLK